MIYKLFIGCIIILAFIYYVSIFAQAMFPKYVTITNRRIHLLLAIIPFYYWIAGGNNDKNEETENEN